MSRLPPLSDVLARIESYDDVVEKEVNVGGEPVWCQDFFECKRTIFDLLSTARENIYYSCFLCDLDESLGCTEDEKRVMPTMRECLLEAVSRGVTVNILYNPEQCYGNVTEDAFRERLPGCNVRCSWGDLVPPSWMLHFSSNKRWSYHHQKYLVADMKRIMVTGCDINGERAGWLRRNMLGYYWHEIAVVVPVSARMRSFLAENFQAITPPAFPLVNGQAEHDLMIDMILGARESVHIENQAFMTAGASRCRVAEALVRRIVEAVERKEEFHAIVFTNLAQQDEPSNFVRLYCLLSTSWAWNYIVSQTRRRGVSRAVLDRHFFYGAMRHGKTLVKVHSNILIMDSKRAIRSSANMNDRSLSPFPADTELGVFTNRGVYAFQQKLFNNYLSTVGVNYTVKRIFELAQEEAGVMRRVQPLRAPSLFIDAFMRYAALVPASGSRRKVNWTVVPIGTPVPQPKAAGGNMIVPVFLLFLMLLYFLARTALALFV